MAIQRLAKQAILSGARRLGINSCLRNRNRCRLLVLCYHGVIPDDHPTDQYRMRVATRVTEFSKQMKVLHDVFTPVSATDILNHIHHGELLPEYAVLVTFDDGFRNNLIWAAPELERFSIPALIFVTTGLIGKQGLLWTQELDERILSWSHATLPMPTDQEDIAVPAEISERWQLADRIRGYCKRLPHEKKIAYLNRLRQEPLAVEETWDDLYAFLSWDEVKELDERGFAIGSHTVSHPILTSLSSSDLAQELEDSKSHIESSLGKSCPWFAYPNGGRTDFSADVVAAASAAGYECGFTLLDRNNPNALNPLEIDRVCITSEVSEDAFHARMNGLLTFFAR